MIVRSVCTLLGLCALAFSQQRPLGGSHFARYQHEIRPQRLDLDGWLHMLGLQEFGLSLRLVRAGELPENTYWMSSYYPDASIGEINVLRGDDYGKRPGCLEGSDLRREQLNTVIHEVLHLVIKISLT